MKHIKTFESFLNEESITEATGKPLNYILTSVPASEIPAQNLPKADVGLGLAMGDKFGTYKTLNVSHYKLGYEDGKVALILTKAGKLAIKVRTEKIPDYIKTIEDFANDYLINFAKKIKK